MSIKKELVSGVFWTSIAKYSGIVVSIGISAVLSRLLSPADFGTVGAATVIIVFFNILGDIGIGPAVIQRQNLSKEDISSIYSLTVYVGFFLAAIFFGLSWPISLFYENPAILPVCQWLSLSILFGCLGIVPQNLQYKAKKFKHIAFVTLAVQVTVGAIAIIYAYHGGGVYALILSSILSSFLLTLIYSLLSKISFRFKLRKESIDKIKSFSLYLFLYNLINYFSRNLDKILVGRFLGMSELGYYEKSYRLMMMPLQNITFVITPVLLPVFSNYSNSSYELGQKYLKLLTFLAYISFPLSIVLFFCGKELILLIFGDQWGPSVWPFQILALTVSLQILSSTTGSMFLAANATKQLFISGCWCAFFMVTSFLITILCFHNLESVCWGFLIAQIANSIQVFTILFKILKLKIFQLLYVYYKPIIISLTIFIGLWFIDPFLSGKNLIVNLILKLITSGIIYLILFQLLSPYNLISIIKSRGKTIFS